MTRKEFMNELAFRLRHLPHEDLQGFYPIMPLKEGQKTSVLQQKTAVDGAPFGLLFWRFALLPLLFR